MAASPTITDEVPEHGLVSRGALLAALILKGAGLSFLLVLLPPLGRQLGFTDIETGALMSLSALAAILTSAFWGIASERFGRKPVLVAGLAAGAVALAALAAIVGARLNGSLGVTAALVLMLVVRTGQMGFVSGMLPAAQAFIADTSAVRMRATAMGLLGASYGVGSILGGAAAWRIGGSHPVAALLMFAVFMLVGLALILLLGKESRSRSVAGQPAFRPLGAARLWPYFGITFVAIAVFSILQQTTALRLQDAFGQTAAQSVASAGAVLLGTAGAMIGAQLVLVRILKFSAWGLVLSGSVGGLCAMTGLALSAGYPALLCSMIVFGVSIGLIIPGNLGAISLRAGPDSQGKAAGVNAVFQGLGMVAGPIAGAALNGASPSLPPLVCAFLMLGVACLAWLASLRDGRSLSPEVANYQGSGG